MEGLITAIQTTLKEIDGIREPDVFLSLDPDVIPKSAGFPCIGLKDGKVQRSELPGGVTELTMNVDVIVYEKVAREEASIRKVLSLAGQVHDVLDDYLLDEYVKDVVPGNEDPIRLMYREKALLLRKIIPYQYFRED